MNPNTNQISFFQVVKQEDNFALFLDFDAYNDFGVGYDLTIEEIGQCLGGN